MSKFLHHHDGDNDDKNDAEAIAIPQVFSKTAELINTQIKSVVKLNFLKYCQSINKFNPFPHNNTF